MAWLKKVWRVLTKPLAERTPTERSPIGPYYPPR